MNVPENKISLDFIPEDIRRIMNRLLENGFAVWLVGGVLRDFFYGWPPKDWDLATSASPQQVIEMFPRVIPLGLRHGTVQIHTDEETVEVTSCPSAGIEGILADLQRRDFTVNALAFSYPGGQLIDPFGGRRDILSRTLRSVVDAGCRFREDPLRTLRAGRFMSVYGFDVEPDTFAAMEKAASGLQRVSCERIREEFFKMLLGEYFSDAFNEMMRAGVIQEFLPEFAGQHSYALGVAATKDSPQGALRTQKEEPQSDTMADLDGSHTELIGHCVNAVHRSPRRLVVRLAALFHHLGDLGVRQPGKESEQPHGRFRESALAAAAIMRRLRTSRRLEQDVAFLLENQVPEDIEHWTEAKVRFFIASVGTGLVEDVLDLASADREARKDQSRSFSALQKLRSRISRELKQRTPFRIADLAISGRDVMRILNLEPGPAVGEVLRRLHRRVLENQSPNEPKVLTDFLEKEYDTGLRSEYEQQDKGGERC
jgi:tRNA nucleotidyltransferase (CCA-adding enzyme)